MNNNYYFGIGRRKEATARVYLKKGTGETQVRTKQKNLIGRKIQTKMAELEKSLYNLNLVLSNQKVESKTTDQTLQTVKFEMEEELIALKKQLSQEKPTTGKQLK